MLTRSRPDENFAPISGKPTGLAPRQRAALSDVSNTRAPSVVENLVQKAEDISRRPVRSSRGLFSIFNSRRATTRTGSSVPSTTRLPISALHPIDEADRLNPQCEVEYVGDIYSYLREVETRRAPSPNYMSLQNDVNAKMRSILIDWLVEVHLKFKLNPETLFLTVNLVDRFLDQVQVRRSRLQLVGVTAMLLACKFEEIYAPEVNDFVYITDRAYSRQEVLDMENQMLATLDFNISVPTKFQFLNRYLKGACIDKEGYDHAFFFAERMLQEYGMLKYTPSIISASCVYLAMRHKGVDWSEEVVNFVQYTEVDLLPCVTEILALIRSGERSSLRAVSKKYSSPKYSNVSSLPLPDLD